MGVLDYTQEELEKPVRRPARTIAVEIASRHGVRVQDMLGRSRQRHLVAPRTDLYVALRAQGWSYPAIGEFVGRHYTTIIYAVSRQEEADDKALITRL
jgi:chromosomal replication initiation ATPase DnaA